MYKQFSRGAPLVKKNRLIEFEYVVWEGYVSVYIGRDYDNNYSK